MSMPRWSMRLAGTLAASLLLAAGLTALLALPGSDLKPVRSAAFDLDEPEPESTPTPVRQ